MRTLSSFFKWTFRLTLLLVLFFVFFMIGSLVVADAIPDHLPSEPGLLPLPMSLFVIAMANLLVIVPLILTSRWTGWKLAITLAFAYYGAVTILTQIETWHFLSSITVFSQLLPRLFLMGVPTAFLFIPMAVWILGKGRMTPESPSNLDLGIPFTQ